MKTWCIHFGSGEGERKTMTLSSLFRRYSIRIAEFLLILLANLVALMVFLGLSKAPSAVPWATALGAVLLALMLGIGLRNGLKRAQRERRRALAGPRVIRLEEPGEETVLFKNLQSLKEYTERNIRRMWLAIFAGVAGGLIALYFSSGAFSLSPSSRLFLVWTLFFVVSLLAVGISMRRIKGTRGFRRQ